MQHPTFRTTLVLAALLFCTGLHAQVGDLHIPARTTDGKVLVKCMPTNASAWYRMMQGGAEVQLEGASPIRLKHGTAEQFMGTNAQGPWKETLATLAREIPAPAVNERDLDAVIKAGKDFDRNYLAWILLTSYDPALSSLSGFQFEMPDDGRDINGTVSVTGLDAVPFAFAHNTLRGDLKGIPFELLPGDKA
ncbi:MAG: hypothetical protein KDB93_15060, partial [Flavobacteriales bacterium]|nr:hypothetical protein [Flavobacteriales bacterium]